MTAYNLAISQSANLAYNLAAQSAMEGGGGYLPPIPGLRAWWDASTTPTGAVTTWLDKSGNGFNATGSGGTRPVCTANQQNGLNMLVFDGTDDFLEVPSGLYSIANGDNTVFAVAKTNLPTTQQRIIAGSESASARFLLEYASTGAKTATYLNRQSNAGGISTTDVIKYVPHVLTGQLNSTTQLISYNSNSASTNASGQYESGVDAMRIGSGATGGAFLSGNIGELIIFNRALTSAERTLVINYLTAKWNTALTVPLSLTPLLWLDGSDPDGNGIAPADNTTVITWVDKSGNGLNASRRGVGNGAEYRTNIQNGLGAILFNPNNLDGYTIPASAQFGLTTGMSGYCVARFAQVGFNGNLFARGYFPIGGWNAYKDPSNRATFTLNNVGTTSNTNGGYVLNTPEVAGFVYNSSNNDITIYFDEVASTTANVGAPSDSDAHVFNIGWLGNETLFFNGYYMELLLFKTAHDATTANQVISYLKNKWGV